MPKPYKLSNYDTVNPWPIKENTSSTIPPNSLPQCATSVHYKKMTHASTYSPCAHTPPSITSELLDTTRQYDKCTNYFSPTPQQVTILMCICTHLRSPHRAQPSPHGYTHANGPQDHANALWDPDLTSSSSPRPPQRELHTTPPKTWAYNSLNSHHAKIAIPPPRPNGKKLDTNLLWTY